jgi:hypothetical protein
MVSRGEWSDYKKGKKTKEYGEFVRKAKRVCKRAPMTSKSK